MRIRVTLDQTGVVRPLFACAIVESDQTHVLLLPTEGVERPWLQRKNYPESEHDSQDLDLDLGLAHSLGVQKVAVFVVNEHESGCTYTVESTHIWSPFGTPIVGSEITDLRRRVHKGCIPLVMALTTGTSHTSVKGFVFGDLSTAVKKFECMFA